jgi:hypothetical protein
MAALASSPLGLLAMRDDDEPDAGDPEELTMPLGDAVTHRFVSRILEPLIEGLALFAEHDATVGASTVVSRVATIGRLLFLPRAGWSDTWEEEYRRLLVSLRRTPDAVSAKRHLLEQPLADRPNYLLGYLAVKAMYRDLARRSARLADPDLFLLLMIDYWFHDYTLARKIAEPLGRPARALDPDGTRTQARLATVLERLQDRLDLLYRDTDRFSAAYEAWLSGASTEAPGYREAPEAGAFTIHEAMLVMRYAKLHLNTFFPKLFSHRTDFRFSAARVHVVVAPGAEVVVSTEDGRLLCRAPAVANAAAGSHGGSVEGIVVIDPWQVAVGIFAVDGLVAVQDAVSGEWNPPALVERLDRMPSSLDVEGAMHALSQARTAHLNGRARTMMSHNDPESERFVRWFYSKIVFWGRPPQARERIAALERDGLRSVVGEERLGFVAACSLLCGVPTPVSDVADMLGLSADALRAKIEDVNEVAQRELGTWLFGLAPGHVLALV